MWVRIDELSFAHGCADEVINHIRDSAVTRHHGESLRGFRLLVDRVNDRALDVSYWDSEDDARADDEDEADPTEPATTSVVRTELYEMAIDAVRVRTTATPPATVAELARPLTPHRAMPIEMAEPVRSFTRALSSGGTRRTGRRRCHPR